MSLRYANEKVRKRSCLDTPRSDGTRTGRRCRKESGGEGKAGGHSQTLPGGDVRLREEKAPSGRGQEWKGCRSGEEEGRGGVEGFDKSPFCGILKSLWGAQDRAGVLETDNRVRLESRI